MLTYERNGNAFVTLGEIKWRGLTVPSGYRFNISAPFLRSWLTDFVCARGWTWFLFAACIHDYVITELKWRRWAAGWLFYRAMCWRGGVWRRVAVWPIGLAVALWGFW